MSRRYRDPIEVWQIDQPELPADERAPRAFRWHRRRYLVTVVLAHWIESGSWWGGAREVLAGAIPAHEVQYWRVEARPERGGPSGIYELCHNSVNATWELARTWD
ncbi:MAG: DUF6504 family protein [Candidatus Nanopelagicales bacterium]